MNTHFVAVDGEFVEGQYRLLQASDGRETWEVYQERHLTFHEIVEFLFAIQEQYKNAVFVGYGMVFDFNLWLRDLPDEKLETLLEEDSPGIDHEGYHITYLPKKIFKLQRNGEPDSVKSVTVYDTISFWQCSFINALGKAGIECPQEIIAGKLARGTFTVSELAKTRVYNALECKLLTLLMQKLESLCVEVGVPLTQWYGPGAIAAKLLHRWRVKREFHSYKEESMPRQLREAIECSFFGGRIENLELGTRERVYQYDIVSAYPAAICTLPVIARWERWKYTPNPTEVNEHGLYRCEWDLSRIRNAQLGPFPWRHSNGTIYYPLAGNGWYHYSEARTALEEYGAHIQVKEAWEPLVEGASVMAIKVPRMFQERAARKAAGDRAEIILKLALNSLYGKFAQRIGSAPFLNLYWAGAITATTRARLFKAAMLAPESVLTLQTDGILTSKPLPLPLADTLGAWTLKEYDSALLILSGYYVLTASDGRDSKVAARGLETKLSRVDLIAKLNRDGKVKSEVTRFITHAQAMNSPRAYGAARCTFMTVPRVLDPLSSTKRHFNKLPKNWARESVRSKMIGLETVSLSAPCIVNRKGKTKQERILLEHEDDGE